MLSRSLLICSVGVATLAGAMIGARAIGAPENGTSPGGVGTCATYSGLPAEEQAASMAFIAGGVFTRGSGRHRPEERFPHTVRVDGFWIDRHEVTNAQFRQFVDATGYVTLAERGLDPKTHPGTPKDLLVPGSVVFIAPTEAKRGRVEQWWQYRAGVNWRQPAGPGSS